MATVIITGSSGLIGSEAVRHYAAQGWDVHGVDNNMRAVFFGPAGDTTGVRDELIRSVAHFTHHDIDVRDRDGVLKLITDLRPALVIHCAAQPSHDRARDMPFVDFDVNAVGTLNLLEAVRIAAPEAVFILMSTNKVYGDAPNELPLVELETRWDYADKSNQDGIAEDFRVDRCLHSLFGASKLAADVVAQEYGKYFGLRTGIFRGGCLTGPRHAAVELHGFLSYLVKVAVSDEEYTIIGYKGKQVRDQIHSSDVVAAFDAFYSDPRPGEVYNLGGGRGNSASVLECMAALETRLDRPVRRRYVDEPRIGDHICYISDLGKLRSHFPEWDVRRSLPEILDELVEQELAMRDQ